MRFLIEAAEGLELIGVRGAGQLGAERVLLRAKTDLNLIRYLVLDTESPGEREIRDLNKNVYWFVDHPVAEGEYVRLYTRLGTDTTHTGTWGGKTVKYHDFFWDRLSPIWRGDSNAVVVVEIASWSFRRNGS